MSKKLITFIKGNQKWQQNHALSNIKKGKGGIEGKNELFEEKVNWIRELGWDKRMRDLIFNENNN